MLKDVIEFNLIESLAQAQKASNEPLTPRGDSSTVVQKNENPERSTQGFWDVDGACPPYQLGQITSPSIPHAPDTSSDKNVVCEGGMTYSTGYIKLPRSLIFDERLVNMPLAYWRVLLVILSYVRFRDGEFLDNGKVISLRAGQACFAIRAIAKDLGGKASKSLVERAIAHFCKVKISRQESRHKKTVITIIDPDIYNEIISCSETRIETKSRQHRDNPIYKKNEKKEKTSKKARTPFVASADAERLCSLFISLGKEKNKGFKVPSKLDSWHKAFEKLLADSSVSPEDVELVTRHIWDTFYGKNIQSPEGLRKKFPQCHGYVTEYLKHEGIRTNHRDSAENIRLAQSWEMTSLGCAPGYGVEARPEFVLFLKPRGNGVQVPYNIDNKEFKQRCREHLIILHQLRINHL